MIPRFNRFLKFDLFQNTDPKIILYLNIFLFVSRPVSKTFPRFPSFVPQRDPPILFVADPCSLKKNPRSPFNYSVSSTPPPARITSTPLRFDLETRGLGNPRGGNNRAFTRFETIDSLYSRSSEIEECPGRHEEDEPRGARSKRLVRRKKIRQR